MRRSRFALACRLSRFYGVAAFRDFRINSEGAEAARPRPTRITEPTPGLIDELFRDKIRAARQMSAEEKLRTPGDLFDEVCERMRDGIRWQFPDADEVRVEETLRERLEIARRPDRL